jgi:hypothetical protein
MLSIGKKYQRDEITPTFNYKELCNYNKYLFSLKSIQKQYRELLQKYPLKVDFSVEDLELMVTCDDNLVRNTLLDTLRNVEIYQVKYDLRIEL